MSRIYTWLTFSVLLLSPVLSAQDTIIHQPTVDAMCGKIGQMSSGSGSIWIKVTIVDELDKLAGLLTEKERSAYMAATGNDLLEVTAGEGREHAVLAAELLGSCPAARERYFKETVSFGDASMQVLMLSEWDTALAAVTAAAPAMLENDQMLLSTLLYHTLQDVAPAAHDTLLSLRGEDEAPEELIAAVGREFPAFVKRHLLETFETTAITDWMQALEEEGLDAYTAFNLENDIEVRCAAVDQIDDLMMIDSVLDASAMFPDEESLRMIEEKYGTGKASRPVLRFAGGMALLQTLLAKCERLKSMIFQKGMELALAALEPTPEEKVKFLRFADELCICIGMSTREEGEACFYETMGKYGMTEENTAFGAKDVPEDVKRMMEVVTTLMPVLATSCRQ